MALPMLPQESNDNNRQDLKEALIPITEESKSTNPYLVIAGAGASGAVMGLVCYYIMQATMQLVLSHLADPLADSAMTALIWSVITTTLAYTLWFAVRPCYQREQDAEEQEDVSEGANKNQKEDVYWDDLEYYYASGVFLGFSAACVISLILAGDPAYFVMMVILSAFVWNRVMASLWPAVLHKQDDDSYVLAPAVDKV